MKTQRQPFFDAGFSLVEVMVASAVLAIVMVILLGTLTTSMALWRNTENKLAADREGRAGELLIAQDLANAILPADPKLWPRVTNSGGVSFLQFLTTKPPDYQSAGDLGDVCFVEYAISPEESAIYRTFVASASTYQEILRAGELPSAATITANRQLLSTNILADARDSVRGLNLYNEASTNSFVVLATNNPGQAGNLLPISGAVSASNPPVAIEVNFSAADQDATANKDLLENEDYRLRNAGYFSFRVPLPKPQQ